MRGACPSLEVFESACRRRLQAVCPNNGCPDDGERGIRDAPLNGLRKAVRSDAGQGGGNARIQAMLAVETLPPSLIFLFIFERGAVT